MLKCFLLFFIIINSLTISVKSIKCYSCASKNMKQDFLTKNRGPKNRVQLPRLFDDSCHWDTWLLKDRGTVDCDGFCYKWQEALNNSGSYSYMTIRACSSHMFSTPAPINAGDIKGPGHSYCSEQIKSLDCLADSNLIDHQCWCQGDYCNSTSTINYSSSIFIILFSVLFIFIKFV